MTGHFSFFYSHGLAVRLLSDSALVDRILGLSMKVGFMPSFSELLFYLFPLKVSFFSYLTAPSTVGALGYIHSPTTFSLFT